jgi:CO dehydrogenase maturation factor
MSTIAISGKGGSGKTTIAAMMVRVLVERGKSVLAVDADPNSTLGAALGTEPAACIADLREGSARQAPATDRIRSLEYAIQQAVTEGRGFDLLAMGRPEGPGCYCAVNNLLRTFLDKLAGAYDLTIIDNEAGMEHLSRRTTNDVDLLCVAAEPTAAGIATADRILELAGQLPIAVKKSGIIWNKVPEAGAGKMNYLSQRSGIAVLGRVPYDTRVYEASVEGKTIFDIDGGTAAMAAAAEIIETI